MSAKQSVTLNDVAREANVSVATVSRVLNRKARADALTQEKVFKAVKKLGYDDSAIARKISEKAPSSWGELKTELLLCPMPEQKNLLQLDFMAEILRGIQNYFNRHRNVTMNISTWEPDDRSEDNRPLLRRLNSVGGIILMGSPDEKLMSFLRRNAIRYVLLPNELPNESANSISSDDFSGGFRAAEYLIQKGFRKIGFLCGSSLCRIRCANMGRWPRRWSISELKRSKPEPPILRTMRILSGVSSTGLSPAPVLRRW